MTDMKTNRIAIGAAFLLTTILSATVLSSVASAQWTQPTKEELEMKEMPGYPGAPAVMLFHEQITKDDLRVTQVYNRVKILTEKGKDEANVELRTFNMRSDSVWEEGTDLSVTDIAGRTIHPDGTIVPFTGKPYVKTLEKNDNFTVKARVFTLPDVEVGSIIEYRYSKRNDDSHVIPPQWYIQGPHFVKAAHYVWYPTVAQLQDGQGRLINSISWFPLLPQGTEVSRREQPGGGRNGEAQQIYEVKVKDIPPAPQADYMPPIGSFTYRVLFAFTPYRSSQEFWQSEGKTWSKSADAFIGPNGDLRSATQTLLAGANTSEEKLRRIYAQVMKLENTDYTRERTQKEDKLSGVTKVSSTSDVLKRERGDSTQLTYLFIGMARAAGFKAYAMLVPNRRNTIFVPQWMNMWEQFSSTIAVVNVDGKDVYFTPGDRYLPYGKLLWNYTYVSGLRQVDGGTAFAQTPGLDYKENKTGRVANLKMTEDGKITGTINLVFEGQEAARWRQRMLSGDEETLRTGLRHAMEEMVPKTLSVKVLSIDDTTDYDKPLKVTFDVKGTIGALTGKRLVLPVDLFTVNNHSTFPQEKREIPVYFHFPQMFQDALRINFPDTLQVEGVPEDAKLGIAGLTAFNRTSEKGTTFVTVRRNLLLGGIMVPKDNYPQLRAFYSQFESKDQESIVLKLPATTASATTPAAPGN